MATIGLPEVFVAFISFLVFNCSFLLKKSQSQPILKNWPFFGMLPGMLANIPRIFDFSVEVIEATNLTFSFKGPWLSGTHMLFTADPRNIHHILNLNFGNYPKGPEAKKIFNALGDRILSADMELWENLRKSNHAIFHHPDFLKLSVLVSSNTIKLKESLIPFLDNAAHEKTIIDLQDVFKRFMFDTSSILMTGYDPMSVSIEMPEVLFDEAVETGEEAFFFQVKKLSIIEEAIYYRYFKPVILWRLQSWLGIELEGKANNHLLLAGRDTTSSVLTWFFWLLSKHPQVFTKIRKEINTNYDPTDLEKLVYLHAALSETMRLYPPLPFNHKSPAKPDVLPSGHKVEANSKIVICIYALGRMRSIWGEDALDFKPERWISDSGDLRHEPSYKLMAFNVGPRACLGKHLALMQIKIVAVEIIQKYDFEVTKGDKIKPVPSVILRMKHGLSVKVTKKI
ncbi:hypothetical protein F2Q69_00041314 [Brassica cretica]|uniref:Alkane hydroxylase MAH1-like n=1 Tax=Brassica cretica TaxID=69181 RepID=A0A8S9NCC4_BRACR|nr:hypothetical protein F2Q69_00041314 [Brassica cretica]